MSKRLSIHVVLTVMLIAVFVSAMAVVYAKHQSRKLFVELQAMKVERDNMEIEWGRLQLEQSTWAAPSRIEGMARKKLDMKIPDSSEVVIVAP